MKTIVEIWWDDKNERKFSIGLLLNSLCHFNIGSVFTVRELPAQLYQGQEGKSCKKCFHGCPLGICKLDHLDEPCIEFNRFQPIPELSAQGQEEKSCENCRRRGCDFLKGVENKSGCYFWQPIPGKVDDRTDFEKQIDFKMNIGTGNPSSKIDDKNLLDLYRKFFYVWSRCESNRGCYSCTELHDCRCEKERKISDKCTCGRDELEAIELNISELDTCHAQGEG